MKQFIPLIFICLFILQTISKKNQKTVNPLDKRPKGFDHIIYCNACQAIVRESLKILKNNKSQIEIMKVIDTISNICEFPFEGYAYVRIYIKAGCIVFLEGWQDILEERLMQRKSNENFEEEFCVIKTKACKGIDPNRILKKRQEIYKNGGYVTIKGKKYRPVNDEKGYVDMKKQHLDL